MLLSGLAYSDQAAKTNEPAGARTPVGSEHKRLSRSRPCPRLILSRFHSPSTKPSDSGPKSSRASAGYSRTTRQDTTPSVTGGSTRLAQYERRATDGGTALSTLIVWHGC